MSFFKKKQEEIKIDYNDMPKHVAVIMDGNGRWAKKRMLPRSLGHRAGMENVKTIITLSSDLGIKFLTLYAFSTENWKRPKEEVGVLMGLLVEYLRRELEEMHQKNVIFNTIGDISKLPKEVINELDIAKEKTKNNSGLLVNIALNYGSKTEITLAVKNIAKKVKQGEMSIEEITEQTVSDNLFTAFQEDPDLMIRTSGEMRLSNFMLYQLAYSEYYFTPVFWPDFNEQEYKRAICEFQQRKRRYGGL